jgi:hypothetical protein
MRSTSSTGEYGDSQREDGNGAGSGGEPDDQSSIPRQGLYQQSAYAQHGRAEHQHRSRP